MEVEGFQTGKGMVTALPACHSGSTILIAAQCEEGVGSESFTQMMLDWSGRPSHPPRWREFLKCIETTDVKKDQWQVQMICRVMELVGDQRVWLVSDGLPSAVHGKLWVRHIDGPGSPAQRAQRAIDAYLAEHPGARVAVVPEGPYTMLLLRDPV